MGSDESHFNVSVGSDGQSHQDSVRKPQPFWRERRAEAVSNWGPSTYQPNTLPLGQTGSRMWLQTFQLKYWRENFFTKKENQDWREYLNSFYTQIHSVYICKTCFWFCNIALTVSCQIYGCTKDLRWTPQVMFASGNWRTQSHFSMYQILR